MLLEVGAGGGTSQASRDVNGSKMDPKITSRPKIGRNKKNWPRFSLKIRSRNFA
jgi:hypothetical protein